jgi:hypothetical protein
VNPDKKIAMKGILYLFLGLVLGACSASAQVTGFSPRTDSGRILIVGLQANIKAMAPDRMPCLIPDLARKQRMPTLRSTNADPMPNGLWRQGKIIVGRPGPVFLKPEE